MNLPLNLLDANLNLDMPAAKVTSETAGTHGSVRWDPRTTRSLENAVGSLEFNA